MQDEIRLRLSSGRELRLYRDDCGRLMAQLSGACSRCIDGGHAVLCSSANTTSPFVTGFLQQIK